MKPEARSRPDEVQRLAKVAARTINGVVITGVDRKIEWVNEGFTRITGYSLEDVAGKSPGQILQGPDTDPSTVKEIRERIRLGNGFTAELLNYRKSGDPFWVRVEVQPLTDDEGRLTGYMGIETDITDIRNHEKELQRQLEQQAVIAQLGERALEGIPSKQLLKDATEGVRRCLGPGYEGMLHAALARSPVLIPSDIHPGLNRGETHFLQSISNILNSAIERERTEAELIAQRNRAEELARSKSQFLANMSHEIRTPLTGIIGFARVLSDEVEGPHREFASLIENSGRRLLDVLNSILDLAKLESSGTELDLQVVDIDREVQDVVRLMHSQADEKDLTMLFEGSVGGPSYASIDRRALSRIMHNLIGNAIKFTEKGTITVSVDRTDDQVEIRVADTGIGMDESFVPHLFQEFTQESTGLTREHTGSGLGLAITRRLVHLLGGEISVETQKGVGSTFTVSLPESGYEPDHPGRQAQSESTAGKKSGSPRKSRMLVVEDNPDTRHLMQHLLEDMYRVDIAPDAEEALRMARKKKYDLVVLDINLGTGRSGIDVERELRMMPNYETSPILALTAYAMPGDREHLLGSGFTAYLGKPFNVDELLEMLSALLSQASNQL